MQKARNAYFQTQATSTTQGELLIMLYDGAINFLTLAKEKIAENNVAEKGIFISKTLDIIAELDESLNVERGGSLATNLHKLYFYASTKLLQANLKLDCKIIDEVIKILSGLRSAYSQIMNTPEAISAQNKAPVQTNIPKTAVRQSTLFGYDPIPTQNLNNTTANQNAPISAKTRMFAYQQQAITEQNNTAQSIINTSEAAFSTDPPKLKQNLTENKPDSGSQFNEPTKTNETSSDIKSQGFGAVKGFGQNKLSLYQRQKEKA